MSHSCWQPGSLPGGPGPTSNARPRVAGSCAWHSRTEWPQHPPLSQRPGLLRPQGCPRGRCRGVGCTCDFQGSTRAPATERTRPWGD